MADNSSSFFTVNGVSVPIVQELSANLLAVKSPSVVQDDATCATLFKRYIRSENERPGSLTQSPSIDHLQQLPVIDMSVLASDSHKCPHQMQQLHMACQKWGFFQVVNHGIPLSLLERTKAAATEFFRLPLQEKQKYSHKPGSLEGYGQAFVFSEDQPLDWADGLFLTLLPEHIRNPEVWPQSPADFKETMEDYCRELEQLGLRLVKLVAENLGLTCPTRLADFFSCGVMAARMNYYPPCPRPDCVLGLSPHSDSALLTILLQDDQTVGLHIRSPELPHQEWLPVQPIPGALVVNIGDSLEVISNGRYKSVEHRAVTNLNTHRLSIATFCSTGPDDIIGPIPELIDEEHPRSYRTFRSKDFTDYYLSSRLQGKKRSEEFIRINHS